MPPSRVTTPPNTRPGQRNAGVACADDMPRDMPPRTPHATRRRPTPRELIEAAIGPLPTRDDRLAELLALLHLGRLTDRVGARVAVIVRDNPPDALERLERAADYIGVTGRDAEHLARLAAELGPTPARDYLAATPEAGA